ADVRTLASAACRCGGRPLAPEPRRRRPSRLPSPAVVARRRPAAGGAGELAVHGPGPPRRRTHGRARGFAGAVIPRAKSVATRGPACSRPETFAAMLRAGVDVVRLNTSHGTVASHTESIGVVRKVAEAEGKTIAVLMDLGGPKLRTGPTKDGRPIELVTGA